MSRVAHGAQEAHTFFVGCPTQRRATICVQQIGCHRELSRPSITLEISHDDTKFLSRALTRVLSVSEHFSHWVLKVEEGTLYPALYRIEQRGWIKSEWGVSENDRRARFYKLTRTGRKQLEVEEANWSHLSLAIGKVLRTA